MTALATTVERALAAKAAAMLRLTLVDPASAGERTVAHLLLARPRRGLWMATWSNLAGLHCDLGRKAYSHALLPGWEYTVAEMRSEMIDDLDRLAATGLRPEAETRGARTVPGQAEMALDACRA